MIFHYCVFQIRDNITKNYEELQPAHKTDRLCAEDLDQLKQWRWDTNITEDREKFLTQDVSETLFPIS